MKRKYKLSLIYRIGMIILSYFVGKSAYVKIKSQGLVINFNNIFYGLVILSIIYGLFCIWVNKIIIDEKGMQFNVPLKKLL